MNLVAILGLFLVLHLPKFSDANCGCLFKYKKVGCFKDVMYDRALPKLISNERNMIEWHNWDNFMPDMICRCADVTIKKGYKYFGLQFWGECWSGATSLLNKDYEKHGKGEKCYGNGYKRCSLKDEHCVGSNKHNFVYEIISCSLNFEKIGCYLDNRSQRRKNDLLITRRDSTNPAFDDKKIDWRNWDTYVPEFACKCAEAAASKNHSVFGLQFYGECWSGSNFETAYYELGTSTNCVNTCWGKCSSSNAFCVGGANSNVVYRITRPDCSQKYEPVGCFAYNADVMSEIMINDIFPEMAPFSGKMLTFGDEWSKQISSLICRCAEKVAEENYITFGITADGLCVSGPNAHQNYDQNGESNSCREKAVPFQSCSDQRNCAGAENSIYVFSLSKNVDAIE